jgi:hypothetical protein
MRDLIILTIFAFGVFWAFDEYKYDGRYSKEAWQQVVHDSQSFRQETQHWLDRATSGQ